MTASDTQSPRLPAWLAGLCRAQGLPAAYADAVQEHLALLADQAAARLRSSGRSVVVGINGAQGSGKSTLALFLEEWLKRESGLSCVRMSLDDVYLGREERRALARSVHPLLATRGVPGTHDVGLALELLDALTDRTTSRTMRLPVFDKALDDRARPEAWRRVDAPADVVLFEGWCVGAQPQAAGRLAEAVNELESVEDADGVWRRYVNDRLRTDYADLFGRLDALIMLRIPDFEKVFEWRRLQERKLRERLASEAADGRASRTQTDEQLRRFISHYERLTRHMLESLPGHADTVIDIDEEHGLVRPGRGNAGGLPASA